MPPPSSRCQASCWTGMNAGTAPLEATAGASAAAGAPATGRRLGNGGCAARAERECGNGALRSMPLRAGGRLSRLRHRAALLEFRSTAGAVVLVDGHVRSITSQPLTRRCGARSARAPVAALRRQGRRVKTGAVPGLESSRCRGREQGPGSRGLRRCWARSIHRGPGQRRPFGLAVAGESPTIAT